MTRRTNPQQLNGGWQLELFDSAPEPEPAPVVGPAPEPTGPTTVVDLHGHQGDPEFADVLYVGRPMFQGGWRLHGHPLSNPFKVGKDGTAEQVVDRYREWLLQRPDLARQLEKLRGRRLGCWCLLGDPCPARVLAELADQEDGQ
ncbi:DUF4326 domain-containing protein [Actinacidiphila glaucinigra]|uniref:DUF4326 domain-containing protein n=1 Tax=Actinacidiphila glaucinigra TaxID=235986 RepID=UPI00372200A0